MKCPKCDEVFFSLTSDGEVMLDELGYDIKPERKRTFTCPDCKCKLVDGDK